MIGYGESGRRVIHNSSFRVQHQQGNMRGFPSAEARVGFCPHVNAEQLRDVSPKVSSCKDERESCSRENGHSKSG